MKTSSAISRTATITALVIAVLMLGGTLLPAHVVPAQGPSIACIGPLAPVDNPADSEEPLSPSPVFLVEGSHLGLPLAPVEIGHPYRAGGVRSGFPDPVERPPRLVG